MISGSLFVAKSSPRRSKVCVMPTSNPPTYFSAPAVALMRRECVVSFVFPFRSSRVSVCRNSEIGSPLFVQGPGRCHQPFGREDFMKLSAHRIIRAVRPAHDDVNFIAWSRVPFANRRGESMRSPPLRYLFRLGACFPNQFTRRIEFPRDNKFLSDLI